MPQNRTGWWKHTDFYRIWNQCGEL